MIEEDPVVSPTVYPPTVYIPKRPPRHNTSNDRHVTYRGETRTLREWSVLLGLGDDPHLLANRLYRYGWTVEKALTTPKTHLSFGKVCQAASPEKV